MQLHPNCGMANDRCLQFKCWFHLPHTHLSLTPFLSWMVEAIFLKGCGKLASCYVMNPLPDFFSRHGGTVDNVCCGLLTSDGHCSCIWFRWFESSTKIELLSWNSARTTKKRIDSSQTKMCFANSWKNLCPTAFFLLLFTCHCGNETLRPHNFSRKIQSWAI